MNIIINILAGVGAFCLAATAWVIAVALVFAWHHTRKQPARAALQPRTTPIARTGIIKIHAANPPFGELYSQYTQVYPTWEVRHIRLDTIRPSEGTEAPAIENPGEALAGYEPTQAEREAEKIIEDLLK